MKLLHTSDWHIGKKLHGFSLANDQIYILNKIRTIALKENIECIIISGDIYDSSNPSEESINILNNVLIDLNLKDNIPILMINGNHDSSIRLGSGNSWFRNSKLYINTSLENMFDPIRIKNVQFFLLPYKSLNVMKSYFHNSSLSDQNSILNFILKKMKDKFDKNCFHILIGHLFVTNNNQKDLFSVKDELGGIEPVSSNLFKEFDYVALGHIHNKNYLKDSKIKYSGSPMKLSLNEVKDDKGVWIIDTNKPISHRFTWHSINPINNILILKQNFKTLTSSKFYNSISKNDFVSIELTDKDIIPNVLNRLRLYYPKIINFQREYNLKYLNLENLKLIKSSTPLDLLKSFFNDVSGLQLNRNQIEFARKILLEIERKN